LHTVAVQSIAISTLVCPLAYLKNHMSQFQKSTYYLWPWLDVRFLKYVSGHQHKQTDSQTDTLIAILCPRTKHNVVKLYVIPVV